MDLKQKQFILFDLDGTITDSGRGIMNSFKYVFKAYGINDYDEKELSKFIGPPLKDSLMSMPYFDEANVKRAIEIYREYYGTIGIFENEIYEGIEQLLKNLSEDGRRLILATSKAEVYAKKVLKHFKIDQYFYGIVGSEFDGTRIKKEEIIRCALNTFGICELNSAVMVGDRMYDIIGAKAAGIDSIGVLYGYGSYEELHEAGAVLIVNTVEELSRVFPMARF